jgi:hypothetical protein
MKSFFIVMYQGAFPHLGVRHLVNRNCLREGLVVWIDGWTLRDMILKDFEMDFYLFKL